MKTRRTFLLSLTSAAVALALVVLPVLAEEMYGRIVKVDVAGKKLHVAHKDTDKEDVVSVDDDTVVVVGKGEDRKEHKIDLEKLEKGVEKAEGKGVFAAITHEKGVASKIRLGFPKKGEFRKKGEPDDEDRKGDEPRPKRKRERPEP
jgi:hypothetical protein